jgi:hypothetical protein
VRSSVDQFASWSRCVGLVLTLLGSATGCQPLDENAALGGPSADEPDGTGAGLESSDGTDIDDAEEVGDGCAAVRQQARNILDRTCGGCHGGGNPGARQGQPPFDTILDTDSLITKVSVTAKDPDTLQPSRFLVPGDPDHSRIYLRPLNREMPPPDVIGLPPMPRPSVSDLSVLRHWIKSCVPSTDMQGADADVADETESDAPNDTTN